MTTTSFDRTRLRQTTTRPAADAYAQSPTSSQSTYSQPAFPQSAQTPIYRSTPMSNQFHMQSSGANSAGWVTFSYASFAMAVGMASLGVWALPGDLWVKGYMMMAMVFLTGATFTLAKTVRDEHEAKRFANRLDEAKTEKLLMDINRG